MARQDFGAKTSFEAHCVQIYANTSHSDSPSIGLMLTWYLLVELNGISTTLGYLSLISLTDPQHNSMHFRSADSDASPATALWGKIQLSKRTSQWTQHKSDIFKKVYTAQSQLLHNMIWEQRLNNSIISYSQILHFRMLGLSAWESSSLLLPKSRSPFEEQRNSENQVQSGRLLEGKLWEELQ